MLSNEFISSVKSVLGTCQALGVLVENKEIPEVMDEIAEGKYSEEIAAQKTDVAPEKRKELDAHFTEVAEKQEAVKKAEAAEAAAEEEAKAAAATAAPAEGEEAAPAAEAAKA
jgi:DNA-directed RNA polymerase alpha subunit